LCVGCGGDDLIRFYDSDIESDTGHAATLQQIEGEYSSILNPRKISQQIVIHVGFTAQFGILSNPGSFHRRGKLDCVFVFSFKNTQLSQFFFA
jgi:hypothetical protein